MKTLTARVLVTVVDEATTEVHRSVQEFTWDAEKGPPAEHTKRFVEEITEALNVAHPMPDPVLKLTAGEQPILQNEGAMPDVSEWVAEQAPVDTSDRFAVGAYPTAHNALTSEELRRERGLPVVGDVELPSDALERVTPEEIPMAHRGRRPRKPGSE